MTQPIEKTVLRVVSLAGLAICVILALWGWKTGILTSQERMEALVAGCGAAGALIFTVFQAVNRLMFCTMIHEHPLYIFHFRYEPYIYKK